MALQAATDSDWAAIAGRAPPGAWWGYVEARPHFIEGFGAIYQAADGRWWLTFARSPGITKTKSAHAGAKRLLADAAEKGITVHVLADPRIDGAEMWVERLGFRRSGEKLEGLDVWTR